MISTSLANYCYLTLDAAWKECWDPFSCEGEVGGKIMHQDSQAQLNDLLTFDWSVITTTCENFSFLIHC